MASHRRPANKSSHEIVPTSLGRPVHACVSDSSSGGCIWLGAPRVPAGSRDSGAGEYSRSSLGTRAAGVATASARDRRFLRSCRTPDHGLSVLGGEGTRLGVTYTSIAASSKRRFVPERGGSLSSTSMGESAHGRDGTKPRGPALMAT